MHFNLGRLYKKRKVAVEIVEVILPVFVRETMRGDCVRWETGVCRLSSASGSVCFSKQDCFSLLSDSRI